MLELDSIHGRRKSRITGLCDDLVILIISFLPLKESITTSVLSRRWRHLWKYSTGCWRVNLCEFYENFEAKNVDEFQNSLKETKQNCGKRVTRTLKSHRAPFLYELAFYFDSNYNPVSTKDIHKWIRIASQKCVRRLDLYAPYVILDETMPIFTHLTHLTLNRVVVTEETLCSFISGSPLLEHLCVMRSNGLFGLKLVGGIKLKHVEISYCHYLTSLEISAPNLVSFVVRELRTTAHFKGVPLLSNLSLVLWYEPILKIIEPLSYLSQIESLTLELKSLNVVSLHGLKLSALKHLDIRIMKWPMTTSFLPCAWFIKASPLLSTFKINFGICRDLSGLTKKQKELVVAGGWRKSPTYEAATIYPHQYLRVVTLCGFSGHQSDTEFALQVIEMATSLDKMVIDCKHSCGQDSEYCRLERSIARQSAEMLRSKLQPSTEFVAIYS